MTGIEHSVARNVATASLSAIKEMAMRAARIDDVASLSWGLPSFRTPEHIREAVSRALAGDPDIGKYALPNGLPELRVLVAAHHARKTGRQVDAEENVFITAGNMQGMNSLFHVLIEPGDEVILTDPGFASHTQQIRLHGGVAVPWALDETRGWRMNIDALPGLISDRTKALVLVNPSNPTGSLFSGEELEELGRIAATHDLVLLIDDPYSELIYENRDRYFNLATRPELAERLAYLFTFSKIHAMSGWRLGYMIVPDWLRAQVLKVHDANMICTPRISQVAGIAALSGHFEHIEEFRQILGRRRTLICQRLDELQHVFTYHRPEGAYYVFPRIVTEHQDSWEFSLQLLNDAHVSVTPGLAFGPSGEHHVRMAYCVSDDEINKAFDRIRERFPT